MKNQKISTLYIKTILILRPVYIVSTKSAAKVQKNPEPYKFF